MNAIKTPETPTITPLDEKQTEGVLDNLNKKGATFFSYETLQNWIKRFRPHAKVSEVQQTLKKTPKPIKQ